MDERWEVASTAGQPKLTSETASQLQATPGAHRRQSGHRLGCRGQHRTADRAEAGPGSALVQAQLGAVGCGISIGVEVGGRRGETRAAIRRACMAWDDKRLLLPPAERRTMFESAAF